ncbi:MAG: ABC transporter substrate-binding protein [Aeromicrobium erythreum]
MTVFQGATEVMLALGLQDRMIGTYGLDDAVAPRYQKAYESVPVIKGDNAPSQEYLLGRKADFVYGAYISAFDEKAAGSRQQLEKLGVASYVSPFSCGTPERSKRASFENVWAEIEDVATLFDVEDRAEELVLEQRKQLATIERTAAGKGLKIFWYDSGDKTPYAGVGTGAPQVIVDTVGATNVFADVKGNWADVSWERVIAADPDVIVLADASWSTAKDKIAYLEKDPALRKLRAVKAKAFVTIPFSETTPGVRVLDGAQHVSDQLTDLKTP